MSSTALRSLSVQSLTWTSVAEVESLCSQLGTILSTSSVTEVWIEDCSLSSTCFLNLASGLRESAQSKLNFLQVWNAWADTSALKQVADMINSAARLETLCLGGEVDRMVDMDEEATRALSQALIQSSSLKTLKVRSPASVKGGVSALKVRSQASVNCGVSALMLNAFAGDGGNRSIDRLQLIGVSGLGNFLPELFTSNRSLKEVEFTAMDVRPEQWALLCQSIRVNSTATTINVVIFKDGISGAALEEIEELACAASSDVKDPVLHLQIYAMDYDVLLSAFNHLGRILRASAKCLTRASTSVEYRSPLPGNNIDLLVQKIDGLDERFILIESIVQGLDVKMGYIVSLQRQLQSTLSTFMSEVDRIIGYSELHQQSRTPKRPYITNDVGFFYRMNASLHLGTTVRLRLMCESVTGFHTVKDQEGLKLRLDRENSGWIPTIIEISYKVLYYAVKTGVDVILGVGQAIPDWDALKTNIVKLDSISDIDRSAIRKGGHSEQLNETWLRIQQTLAPQLKDSFSRIFNLYLVKYVGPQNGGHAWVCADCMHKAKHAGSLTF
ncbi:hypothetical protein AXG93_3426s1000 [Marchantia polymorpha subsp. ruderalis]|uniref:Uncharacterized protein n=1 Tax=Marchantia polymorpha subsp. ruderalis TaxID=1480154 RepID=A0A176VCV5_MARPO|nr:hypothetical protein AXG93_3426s1000 [Marchantia polymorpha subsp. ruderalis]